MKTILKTFLVLCLCTIANVAFSNGSTNADQLFDQEKFQEVLQIYLLPEHNQDSNNQNRIGYIYLKEFKDEKKAFHWFMKSAEQGDMYGQYNLGQLYKQGIGGRKDYQQAFQWLSKAAEQGHAKAMATLGNLYADGLGVEKDEVKAVTWYVEAAKKDDRDGQCNAAGIFTHGTVINTSYHNARLLLEWCLKSDPDDDCCLERMAVLYSKGWGVKQDRKKAHELRTKAATNGNAVAMYMLAGDFDYGIGVEKNPKAALEWYLKAAEKGESYAMYRLYEVYEYGKLGQSVDKTRATAWKAKAEAAMKEEGVTRNELMDRMRLRMEAESPT
ncbi:sel1 repeat family protein [Oxalobacter vibrioformis]|uniref:Sel1 repeat family protein n=1 Tax=Oxalobacter vibrioformis TaxID=933080 RepID=A0A9E9P2U8_9BURK|nr:tetratricopeptide repeat protein [Oxalobacter vibrioformis]WAW10289.1 sel1 repeat family protein [Oxalobacter vibrioformis]